MEAISFKNLLSSSLFIVLASCSILSPAQATEKPYQEASTQFIRTSCSTTTYPSLCFSSLAKHASFIQSNRVLLTGTSLNVTLASAKATSALMSTLSNRLGLQPREIAAMKDCVEEISESVDELRRSIDEMGHLRNSNFDLTMNNVQTWVSAALTDENTCADGFQGANGNIKTTVRGRIAQVAQMTSNALSLINQLASFHR